MKTIDTLIPDIENLLNEGVVDFEGSYFGEWAGRILARGLAPRETRNARVWFSNVGDPCIRKLWYKVNEADKAEPLPPSAKLKFIYGDLLEELLLSLAREAGHSVECEQESLEWNGITGRIDAVIDGMLVDTKSASSYSFKRFQGGLRSEDDSFGYLGQLGGYLLAARETGIVEERNRAAFFVINKETGKLCLDVHEFTDEGLEQWAIDLEENKRDAQDEETTPDRAFEPEAEGRSGNLKLGVNCSYCEFKGHCWPGLRTFLYSNRPVHLVHVEREPMVPELLSGGNDE